MFLIDLVSEIFSQILVRLLCQFSVEVKEEISQSDGGCMMKIVNEELEKKVFFL